MGPFFLTVGATEIFITGETKPEAEPHESVLVTMVPYIKRETSLISLSKDVFTYHFYIPKILCKTHCSSCSLNRSFRVQKTLSFEEKLAPLLEIVMVTSFAGKSRRLICGLR